MNKRTFTKITKIDPALLERYVKRELTSAQLAKLADMNAGYLRRAIKRPPLVPIERVDKAPLIAARKAYRATLAELNAADIAGMAHVSLRTAYRIRAKAAKLAPKAQT